MNTSGDIAVSTEPTTAYFFGVCPGDSAGHYLHTPGPRGAHRDSPMTPWGVQGRFGRFPLPEGQVMELLWPKQDDHRRPIDRYEPEGEPRFNRKDGWTLVGMWDRSADKRGACCAIFAFSVECDDDQALALARQLFPRVFTRIEAHLGREVRPAPARCPTCRQDLD